MRSYNLICGHIYICLQPAKLHKQQLEQFQQHVCFE